MSKPFQFKEFTIHQDKTAMKVGTDGVLLGAWCSLDTYPDSILDIGSGTGLLSLMMAQRSDAMTIDAVEIDENAYEQTVENFEQSDWGDRLFCYHTSFQDFVKEMMEEDEKYDYIISNPPFYTDDYETQDLARNSARFFGSGWEFGGGLPSSRPSQLSIKASSRGLRRPLRSFWRSLHPQKVV